MTELDKALESFDTDREDPKKQSLFYDTFLNARLYVPTLPEKAADAEGASAEEPSHALPVIVEAEGNDYLMVFDSEERMKAWAQEEVNFIVVPGHVVASTSPASLHWAMNVGTDYTKQFVPEEIAFLKDAVARCKAEAGGEG